MKWYYRDIDIITVLTEKSPDFTVDVLHEGGAGCIYGLSSCWLTIYQSRVARFFFVHGICQLQYKRQPKSMGTYTASDNALCMCVCGLYCQDVVSE